MIGKIVKLLGGFYYIDINGIEYECRARGLFRKQNIKPVVGDIVEIQKDEISEKKGYIIDIKDRKNFLLRPEISNVDNMIIIVSIENPEPNIELIDKMILHCYFNNINPIICINKIDLDINLVKTNNFINYFYGTDIDIIKLNNIDFNLLEDLKKRLYGKINVFTGLSGVGKSTIIGNLLNREDIQTGEISIKIKRGKHTTRHSELFKIFNDTYICDTPGFSNIKLPNIDYKELRNYFKEYCEFQKKCKFDNCLHINEPNCNVIDNLSNNYFSTKRYELYKKFLEELKNERKY